MEHQNNTPIDSQEIELDDMCSEYQQKWAELCIEIEMMEDEIQNDINKDNPDSYIRTTHILRGRGEDWEKSFV